jgi:hypothetical protein
MKQLPPDLTPAQIKVYEVIQRNRMAWTTLVVVLGLLIFGFFSFLYAMFFLPQQGVAKGVLGGIDLLLGWALHRIVGNLFPKSKGGK